MKKQQERFLMRLGDFSRFMCAGVEGFVKKKCQSLIIEEIKQNHMEWYIECIREINILFISQNEILYNFHLGGSLFVTRNKKKFKETIKKIKYLDKNLFNCTSNERYFQMLEIRGEFLNIPECCIKQYIQDNRKIKIRKDCMVFKIENEAEKSYERYKKQLKKLKIKDKFGLKKKNGDYYIPHFIPCKPNCKEALKKLKKLNN